MARKGGAVTGVMSCVVHGIDMRKTGEVNEESAQYGSADSGHDTLALGGATRSGVGTAGADGHGACLGSDDGQQSARKPRERSSQGLTAPAHRGFVIGNDQAGLRACEGLTWCGPANISFPCRVHSGCDVSLAYRCGGSTGLVGQLTPDAPVSRFTL